MNRDLLRQIVTVVAFAITVTLNSLANALPLNGQQTGAISDRFTVLVVPAGYVFAIWGVIYLGQLAFTVLQALPSRREDPLFRRLGYLPAVAGALNALWIVLWHWEVFAFTVPVMVALLVVLSAIYLRIRAVDGADGRASTGVVRWAARVPFSVYLGWITVATIANIAAMLSWAGFGGLGVAHEAWAVVVLVTGLAIASTVVLLARDPAYGLVIAWAYGGIVVKESAVAPVAVTAAIGVVLMLGLVALTFLRRDGAGAATRATPLEGAMLGR
jgi:benzodiazapine receptor